MKITDEAIIIYDALNTAFDVKMIGGGLTQRKNTITGEFTVDRDICPLALCPDKIGVGINVSGSHMKAVLEGDTVTATARLLHHGRTLHQWHVEIRNEAGELISSVEVTNYIIPKGK